MKKITNIELPEDCYIKKVSTTEAIVDLRWNSESVFKVNGVSVEDDSLLFDLHDSMGWQIEYSDMSDDLDDFLDADVVPIAVREALHHPAGYVLDVGTGVTNTSNPA